MLRALLMAAVSLVTAQTLGYDWNGFTAATLGCGSDSGALNVGLSQSLPPGATGLKVKQIAFAIYGTNSLPAFIQLDGSTATPRVSTSTAVQCCGSGCDLAVQVGVAGYSWYNSPCGQPSCANANKWYYMDFSATTVGTTEQTGISQATFYNSGGTQIGANMINLGSGSLFFMSYTAIIPSPTPTPSLTKSPVSPSLTASETGSTSVSRSVTASGSTDPTDSRSMSASRSESRSPSTTTSASWAPSVTVSPSRAASPVSPSVSPTVTPYLPWFQGLTGCCHNSIDTSVQALNVLTPYPYPNMAINRLAVQFWPLSAGSVTFSVALMNVAGISTPGGTILASTSFTITSPGSFPTFPQQVAVFNDLGPISSYVLGGDVEYALAFYAATPGIIDLVLGVPSLSPHFWDSLMTEPTGSFYTVGETDPTTASWYQSTNIAFVAAGAGQAITSSPSASLTTSSSHSTSLSATTSLSSSITATASSSSSASPTTAVSQSATTSSSSSLSASTDVSQSTSVSASSSISGTTAVSESMSMSATSSGSPTTAVSQSASISTSSSSSSSISPTTAVSQSQSTGISASASSSSSFSISPTTAVSQSTSVSASSSISPTTAVSQSTSVSATSSSSSSSSISPTTAVSQSQSTGISASASSSSSFSISPSTAVSHSQSTSISSSSSSSVSATTAVSQTTTSSLTQSVTSSSSRSSDTTGSPSVSRSVSVSVSISSSGIPQSFQQVNNISTAMSATSTPQFMFTAYPTTSPTYSPTQNATLPIIVVDGQATNMTTTNALLGTTLALIIVAVALAAGRYLPAGWAQLFRRMIPQSTIDSFKRDPLGSVTAMVNDPKSILKNVNIQIPDSVKSITDMVPQSIKDKIVPQKLQELVGIAPSATVPHIEADEKPESVTPETSPQPPASSRKIDIAPPPPVRRAITPEPILEEAQEEEEEKPAPLETREEKPVEVNVENVTGVVEDGGIVTKKEEVQVPSTFLKIDAADLEAVQAFLKSKNVQHEII